MKKIYLIYVMLALFSIGHSQTIVAVDRANIVGPTTTGNDPSISSTGFTRGSGVALSNPGAANFTTNQWNATTQAGAVTNNDYIQWSTTASAANSINITSLDIRTRRNANGPADWQIFYSLDGFATAGTAVAPAEITPASPNAAINFNFSGLTINSGTAGTITFRLYAWNAPTTGGWFRIANSNSWSAFGVSSPGLRLSGTISSINSADSDIIATNFDPSDNIDYRIYNATSGLTISNTIKVGEFQIRDGGISASDTDTLPTELTSLEFNILNSANVAALALFDGAVKINEALVVSGTATFSGITSLSAADNSSKTFSIHATFSSSVTDNEQIQLSIATANANFAFGSVFDASDAGGAQTPLLGDDNRIEVIASKIGFGQQPTDVNQFETMLPYPTIEALDSNNNTDLDHNSNISVLSTDGDMSPSNIIYPITNGIASLNTLIFTKREVVAFLNVTNSALGSFASSLSFNVNGPLINIARQDFDGMMPEWTYTTDVTPFDNGWGTDGYYNIIDSVIAIPLDNPLFLGNIFGENDINDEGDNGTSDFATLIFDTIDISDFDNVRLTFDWDIHGYENVNGLVQYRLIYDGVAQPYVFLLDGTGAIATDEGTVSEDILSTVNTLALEVRLKNRSDINGFSGFDNFRLSTVFDGLIHIDDGTFVGWEPSAPNGTTGSQNAYVYSGTYNVGTNIQVNDFFIRNGATTTISAGQSITTNSGVLNNGTLELNSVSTSYSSLITDRIDGEVIYNRHVNQRNGTGSTTGNNDLISAPVTNASQTFLALRTVNTDIPSGLIGGVPSFLFGPFNNVTNNYINYSAANDASLIEAGIGYRTASIQPTGSTFRFVGDAETGSKAIPITVGAGSRANLIGNPYPSYLRLSTFLTANNSQFNPATSGVYGYIGNLTTGFRIWNQAYSDANPTAKLAPGQGFFVNSKTGGGTINFTPAMRTIGTTDDFISGRSTNLNLAHMYIQATKGEEFYQTDLYFNDNASLSMDTGYDSEMFEELAPDFAIYSHLVEDNLGSNLAVQSVRFSDLENVTIPIGINTVQGEQVTVSISESNIPEDTSVTLEDNVTNTFTDLLESDYSFTPATTLTSTGRFYIHLSRTTLGLNDNILTGLEIYTNNIAKTIVVKGQLEEQTIFNLYDIQGRIVKTEELNHKNTIHSIDTSNLSAGIYIIELQNNAGNNRTQKVIIR